MIRKIVLLCLLGPTISFASDELPTNQSEKLHQAASKIYEITPTLGYASTTRKYVSGLSISKQTIDLFLTGIQGEYGVTKTTSIGLNLLYGWTWADNSPQTAASDWSAVGWYDPKAYLKKRIENLGPGAARLFLSVGQTLSDKVPGRNYSGGTSFSPAVAYEIGFDNNLVGVQFSYSGFINGRTLVENEVAEFKIRGGNSFTSTLFYEKRSDVVTMGISVDLAAYASSKFTAENLAALNSMIAAGYSGDTGDYSASSSLLSGSYYASFELDKDLQLVPQLSYFMSSALDKSVYSSFDGWALEVAARYEL